MLFWWACPLVNLRLEQSHNCVSGRILRLWMHIASPVTYLWLQSQMTSLICDSSRISVTPVTNVHLQSQHVILVTCWPFVLEIAPLSIINDVIACQSSTGFAYTDHCALMHWHIDRSSHLPVCTDCWGFQEQATLSPLEVGCKGNCWRLHRHGR
jgi:hypothetical protein